MLTEYKGYSIIVEFEKNAHPEMCYVAYINNGSNGSEHTRGSSEETALNYLKTKIDNYPAFSDIYLRPLSKDEQTKLECYIHKNARSIFTVLKKEHLIFPGRFASLTMAAIYNHYHLIEDILRKSGFDIPLDRATLEKNEVVEKVVLFASDYYANKKSELENALRNH